VVSFQDLAKQLRTAGGVEFGDGWNGGEAGQELTRLVDELAMLAGGESGQVQGVGLSLIGGLPALGEPTYSRQRQCRQDSQNDQE
jgi:hypothetical protein